MKKLLYGGLIFGGGIVVGGILFGRFFGGQDLSHNPNNFTTLSTIDPNFMPIDNITTTNFSEDYSPYRYNTTQLSKFNTSYAPNSTIFTATSSTEFIPESFSNDIMRQYKDLKIDFEENSYGENAAIASRKLSDLNQKIINDYKDIDIDCKVFYDFIRVIGPKFPNEVMDALGDQLKKEDESESSCDVLEAVVDISKQNEPKIREALRQKNG